MYRFLFPVSVGLVVVVAILAARDAAGTHTSCLPSTIDLDSDGLPLGCDPSDSFADIDGDGFKDSLEVFASKDPQNSCSHPVDVSGDGIIDIGDVFWAAGRFNAHADDPEYVASADFLPDERIRIDDVFTAAGHFFENCPFDIVSGRTAKLEGGTIHFEFAQLWFSNVGNIYVENDTLVPGLPTCEEVKRAADHWTNNTDFNFSVGLSGNCVTTSDVRVFLRWTNLLPDTVAAEVVPYDASLRKCTEAIPCHYAHFAEIFLNPNYVDDDIVGDEDFRHALFTHELGHVVGQGHTQFFPACGPVPYTIMARPGYCWDLWNLHWVRVNDVVFTNAKY